MSLLGIDLGSTGVKATLADNSGKFLMSAYRAYHKENQNNYNELDPNNIWCLTQDVITEVVEQGEDDVLGLSVSSFGESFILLNKDNQCLSNIILYSDYRGQQEISHIEKCFGMQKLVDKTGLKPNKGFSISKLLWFKENQPELYRNIAYILPVGSFILYKLSGQFVVDHSLASRTYLYNISSKNWDAELLEYCELHNDQLPQILEIGSYIGTIVPELARQFGLNNNLKIVLGGHDQICCMIGSGVNKPTQAMDGMGTVDCIAPLFHSTDIKGDLVSVGYAQIPYRNNLYTTYAYIYDCGSLIDWYRHNYCSALEKEAEINNISLFTLLSKKLPESISDLLVLPHFSGASTPYQDDESRGIIYGLTLHTEPLSLYKAILEGIAFEMKQNILALEQRGIRISELIAAGGGSKSTEWLQIKADIYEKPIYQLEVSEAGTLGVIILAGIATGVISSFEEAIGTNIKIKAVFQPIPEKSKIYQAKFKHYQKLYEAQKMISD